MHPQKGVLRASPVHYEYFSMKFSPRERRKMKRYGVPYRGSKNKIAEWVIEHLPSSKILVDLFAGGCAITDCALQSSKWDKIIANDLDGSAMELYQRACCGEYADESRWIGRDEFKKLKDVDPYVRWIWSFGNDGRAYIYSKEREQIVEPIHKMIMSKDPHEARMYWRRFCKMNAKETIMNGNLQSLESLERLQSLEKLKRLTVYNMDYKEVKIPEGATVYCDIPYRNTKGYEVKFDHEEFYKWALNQTNQIYISEYWMPEDKFKVVAERKTRSIMGATVNLQVVERIYTPIK